MARPRKISSDLVQKAQEVINSSKNMNELKEAQAILLPAIMGATLEETGAMLGIGRATVNRFQNRFKERVRSEDSVAPTKRNWGGRRRTLMPIDEEKEFLLPWEEKAKSGGILVVSVIRAALAQKLGRAVKASVVYRLLARHGWRKVAPDSHHPKSDPAKQEEWKKNSRKRWHPCPQMKM
jgi:transposase